MNPLRRSTSPGNPHKPVAKSPAPAKTQQQPPNPGEAVSRNPEILLEGFVDKLCRYVGVIADLPAGADMNNRMYLLDKLDGARREGQLPWTVTAEQNIILGLSAYSVKLSKATQEPVLILRIPIHEVASLSYINDDQEHLLFLKAGDAQKSRCKCHVICCKSASDAELICRILKQALQLVYSKPPLPAAAGDHVPLVQRRQTNRSTDNAARSPTKLLQDSDSFSDSSDEELDGTGVSNKLVQEAKRTSRLSKALTSDGEDEGSAEAVVQRYMERLNRLMGYQDIKEFATLLRQYREDNMPVTDFCDKLRLLYGDDRKFLLPGMSSFIPEEDNEQFVEFLTSQGLEQSGEDRQQPDLDQMLAGIDQEMGDVEQNFEHMDS